MRTWSWLFVLVFGASSVLSARALDSKSIDAIFSEYSKPGSPGCSVAAIRDGKTIFARGYGLASLELGVALTPETVFDIGSTSKQFTAASILLLVEDGKLSLDDEVKKHLPEFPAYGTSVTIRHLLHHTSGVRDYINVMMFGGFRLADHTTAKDALAAIIRQKTLDFPPGSEHSYSNSGYFLLSEIVGRVSGKPIRDFARERIFEPLGMKDTQILDDHTRVVPKKAWSYEPREGGGFALVISGWEQTGDGAVQTTVGDLARWDANFYTPKVGGAKLIAELERTGQLADGSPIDYARGLQVDQYRGLRRVRHGGAWLGFRAQMTRFPEAHFTAIVLCNHGAADNDSLVDQMTDLVLADRLAPREAAPAKLVSTESVARQIADPTRYVGLYWSEDAGLVRRIEARDGRLWYVRGPGNESELAPTAAADRFQMLGVPTPTEVAFQAATPSAPRGMDVFSNGQSKPQTRFREADASSGVPPDPAEFAGTYASSELATRWRLMVEGTALVLEDDRGEKSPLTPVFADAFQSPSLGVVRFTRDAERRVTGLVIGAGRARNLRFEREGAGG